MSEQERSELADLITTHGPSKVLSALGDELHQRRRVLDQAGEHDASLAMFEAALVVDYQAGRLQDAAL